VLPQVARCSALLSLVLFSFAYGMCVGGSGDHVRMGKTVVGSGQQQADQMPKSFGSGTPVVVYSSLRNNHNF
jgi:hypothetical protein